MAEHEQHRLGQVLVELGLLDRKQLAACLAETTKERRLGKVIVDRGIVTEDRLVSTLAKHLGLETINPEATPVHERVLQLVPAEVARKIRVIPIARRKEEGEESLFLATADPFDGNVEKTLGELIPGMALRFFLASEQEISGALDRHYGNGHPKVRTGGSAAIEVPLAAPMDVSESATIVDPERIGRYDLLERIGVDATAEVYLTDQSMDDGRRLVLRRPLPKLPKNEKTRKRFFGDAEKCIGLKHPNIVEVHEVVSRGGQWYVVQEHVDGVDLSRLFHKMRKLKVRPPERVAIFVASRVVDAVDYAYTTRDSAGRPLRLLHHCLSPMSVLVTEEGHVKVQGFGLEDAAVVKRSDHAAPEQIKGGTVDERTVVFRAGVILYELICGVPLFEEGVGAEEMEKALASATKSFRTHCPDASPELEKIVVRMLAFNSVQRFSSMRDVKAALDGLLGSDAAQRMPLELGRFVRSVLGNTDDSRDFPRVRETPIVPALNAASETVERIVDRTAPQLKQMGKKGGESLAHLLERFGAWFAGAPRSQQIATILIPLAVVFGTIIGVVAKSEKPVVPAEIAIDVGEEETEAIASALASPEEPAPKKEPVLPAKTILPGIVDVPAPEGSSYVAIEGAELRETNEDDGEVLLWLEAGTIVERIRPMGTRMLVMVPPKGPVGFISGNALSKTKPIEVLGKEIGFRQCKVDARRSLDDCLVKGKEQLDNCHLRCKKHAPEIDHTTPPGSRCAQACQAAFDRCARQCNESKVVFDREQERKQQQQKRRRRRR